MEPLEPEMNKKPQINCTLNFIVPIYNKTMSKNTKKGISWEKENRKYSEVYKRLICININKGRRQTEVCLLLVQTLYIDFSFRFFTTVL